MQSLDLPCYPFVHNIFPPDLSTMSDKPSTAIHGGGGGDGSLLNDEQQYSPNNRKADNDENRNSQSNNIDNNHGSNNNNSNKKKNNIVRRERPSRVCTVRSSARLNAAAAAAERKQKSAKKERPKEVVPSLPTQQRWSDIMTPLVNLPPPSQLPRWGLRSMWELASILNFLNVFRPLLNIKVEFSAEEFETALIMPNNTLGDIHMPILKYVVKRQELATGIQDEGAFQREIVFDAIPPITRMALGQNTWVTILCRKLRDWWHWVAEGELPIVASHGAEVEAYNALDPGVRVVILKALCDIRVEQEDIRNYIDDSIKHGVQLSAFRKEHVAGDSHGISFWYEDDPTIGHRLYREIRKGGLKRGKGKTVQPIPNSSYQWETVATNSDEFQDVSEKLFASKNRTEAWLGKKLKIDMLPDIEKVHKRKEKMLKKQHRQALLLDSMISVDGLGPGRSLRDRKPVTYTFDDYDRSINEAIKITKQKQPSPEPTVRRELLVKPDVSTNGIWSGPPQIPLVSFEAPSPKSPDYDETDEDNNSEMLDRSNRRRLRPQRYSAKDYVEAVSDNEADFESDDDIVGEAIYDEEYLRRRKQRKLSSSSEGDEEYHCDGENDEDEDDDDEEEDSSSIGDESDEPQRFKKLPSRTRRETKLRSVDKHKSGLRRSKRATRNHINYKQYELSESETGSMKSENSIASGEHSDASDNVEFSVGSEDSEDNDNQEMKIDQPIEQHPEAVEKEQHQPPDKSNSPCQDEVEGVRKRRFLDLNELAPGSGFDDGTNTTMKDEDTDDF